LIPVKKGKPHNGLKLFLKEEVKTLADLLISSNPELENKTFSLRYRNVRATYRYGDDPNIGNLQPGIDISLEMPEAVARARFEDAHYKGQHLTEKDGYCKYCSCLINPPEGIKRHLQSDEHKRIKKQVQTKQRQFKNEMKWIRHSFIDGKLHFFLISPKIWEKIGDLPINKLSKYKIADLSVEDLIEYQKGLRKCQTCGTWFKGRIDAVSCSDKCRVARSEKKIREFTGKRATL
jgi:hypothetical protein